MYDPIGPSTTHSLMDLIHENKIGDKFNSFIVMYDPTGVVVEKWLLDGTMLTNVGFGDLSMDDDGIAEITATLRFDRAILLF